MKKIITILAVALVIIIALSALALSSLSKSFLFSKELTVATLSESIASHASVVYDANVTDSKTYIGELFIRIEPNSLEDNQKNMVFSIGHKANTELDTVVLTFSSREIALVYFGGMPSVEYSYSTSPDSITVTIDVQKALGSLQSTLEFDLILNTVNSYSTNLLFSADILMHYMEPLQLTALRAHTSFNTYIPETNS